MILKDITENSEIDMANEDTLNQPHQNGGSRGTPTMENGSTMPTDTNQWATMTRCSTTDGFVDRDDIKKDCWSKFCDQMWLCLNYPASKRKSSQVHPVIEEEAGNGLKKRNGSVIVSDLTCGDIEEVDEEQLEEEEETRKMENRTIDFNHLNEKLIINEKEMNQEATDNELLIVEDVSEEDELGDSAETREDLKSDVEMEQNCDNDVVMLGDSEGEEDKEIDSQDAEGLKEEVKTELVEDKESICQGHSEPGECVDELDGDVADPQNDEIEKETENETPEEQETIEQSSSLVHDPVFVEEVNNSEPEAEPTINDNEENADDQEPLSNENEINHTADDDLTEVQETETTDEVNEALTIDGVPPEITPSDEEGNHFDEIQHAESGGATVNDSEDLHSGERTNLEHEMASGTSNDELEQPGGVSNNDDESKNDELTSSPEMSPRSEISRRHPQSPSFFYDGDIDDDDEVVMVTDISLPLFEERPNSGTSAESLAEAVNDETEIDQRSQSEQDMEMENAVSIEDESEPEQDEGFTHRSRPQSSAVTDDIM